MTCFSIFASDDDFCKGSCREPARWLDWKASAIDVETLRICDGASSVLQLAQGIRSEMVTVYGSHDPGSDPVRAIESKLENVVVAAVAQVQPLAM